MMRAFLVVSKLCGLEVTKAVIFCCCTVNISPTEKRKQKSSHHSLDIVVELKELLKSVLSFGFLVSKIENFRPLYLHSPGFHVQVAYTVYYKARIASLLLVLQNMNCLEFCFALI